MNMAKTGDITKLQSVKILDMLFSSPEFKSIKNLFKYIKVEHYFLHSNIIPIRSSAAS
jgi:hypothetical protein